MEHDGTLTQEDRQKIQSLLAQSAQGAAAGGQVGLRNVSQRLNLIYGDEGTLTLDQTRAGTVLARVAHPCRTVKKAQAKTKMTTTVKKSQAKAKNGLVQNHLKAV